MTGTGNSKRLWKEVQEKKQANRLAKEKANQNAKNEANRKAKELNNIKEKQNKFNQKFSIINDISLFLDLRLNQLKL